MEQHLNSEPLFDRIVRILESARGRVVASVNHETVAAYWLIGREIVQVLQDGEERAGYGEMVIRDLSNRLTEGYGKGFSSTNLWYFRQFYLAYANRGLQAALPASADASAHTPPEILHPMGGESPGGFHPSLSWSHYRALMRVEHEAARDFYETEAVRCGWTRRELERQISTLFYERLLASQDKAAMLQQAASPSSTLQAIDVLKDPYIHESQQLFASRYMLFLPTEEQLRREVERQRTLIESRMVE